MRFVVRLFIVFLFFSASVAVRADDSKNSKSKLLPDQANVRYGDDKMNVLDFWQAAGDGPRPLLVYIHGGGWIGGDKKRTDADLKPYLDRGISYAAVNYRLTGQASLINQPLPDA